VGVDAVPSVPAALDDAGVGEAVEESTGSERIGADGGGEFVEGASCGVDSCVEVPGQVSERGAGSGEQVVCGIGCSCAQRCEEGSSLSGPSPGGRVRL
jgi:hypothetical protein